MSSSNKTTSHPTLRHKASNLLTNFRARPSVSTLSGLFKKNGTSTKLTLDEEGQKRPGEKSYGWVCCKCGRCNLLWQRPGMRCRGRNCSDNGVAAEAGNEMGMDARESHGHLTWVEGDNAACRTCTRVEIYKGDERELLRAGQQSGETGWVHDKDECMQWHGNMWSDKLCNGLRGCRENVVDDLLYTVMVGRNSVRS